MRTVIGHDGGARRVLIMKPRPHDRARVELATDPLEVAVVIGQERLAARISPATARRLAAVLIEFATPRTFSPRLRAGRR